MIILFIGSFIAVAIMIILIVVFSGNLPKKKEAPKEEKEEKKGTPVKGVDKSKWPADVWEKLVHINYLLEQMKVEEYKDPNSDHWMLLKNNAPFLVAHINHTENSTSLWIVHNGNEVLNMGSSSEEGHFIRDYTPGDWEKLLPELKPHDLRYYRRIIDQGMKDG